jgi:hypothetical protein
MMDEVYSAVVSSDMLSIIRVYIITYACDSDCTVDSLLCDHA